MIFQVFQGVEREEYLFNVVSYLSNFFVIQIFECIFGEVRFCVYNLIVVFLVFGCREYYFFSIVIN